jgi:hypothetical protein
MGTTGGVAAADHGGRPLALDKQFGAGKVEAMPRRRITLVLVTGGMLLSALPRAATESARCGTENTAGAQP